MKVLVYGAKGWIGGMMCSLLSSENIEYIASTLRVSNKMRLKKN